MSFFSLTYNVTLLSAFRRVGIQVQYFRKAGQNDGGRLDVEVLVRLGVVIWHKLRRVPPAPTLECCQ